MNRSCTRTLVPFLFAALVVATAAGYGCGSSNGGKADGGNGAGGTSSGSSATATCQQACDKYISLCLADGGAVADLAKTTCASACTKAMPTSGPSCKNESAIVAAYMSCLNETTCDGVMTCTMTKIPACEGGSGGAGGSAGSGTGGHAAGGTTGAGGITGLGGGIPTGGFGGFGGFGLGGFGGFDGSGSGTCADLLACCNKATGIIQSACMTAYTNAMPSGDSTCGIVLGSLKAQACP